MHERLLRLAERGGLTTRSVTRGAVVVSRRPGPQIQRMGHGMVLVAEEAEVRAGWPAVEKALDDYACAEHVADLLRAYRVNAVLDVGANRGQFGARLRRTGYRGHIVSFEPVREPFERLRRRAADDPRWSVVQCALGAEDGAATINAVGGTMSSLLEPTAFGAKRYGQLRTPRQEEIAIRRLDGLLDEVLAPVRDPRPYLKLDTQGYDLQAFAGLGERARDLVGMQAEVAVMQIYRDAPLLPDSLAAYEAAGFAVSALYPVSREGATGRVVEFDCVMVRPEAR